MVYAYLFQRPLQVSEVFRKTLLTVRALEHSWEMQSVYVGVNSNRSSKLLLSSAVDANRASVEITAGTFAKICRRAFERIYWISTCLCTTLLAPADFNIGVVFQNNGSLFCSSCGGAFVGRQPKGQEQRVKMAANCLQKKGMFMHALLHTLGIFHENSRMDRDAYVSVMCGNVQKGDVCSQFSPPNFSTVPSFAEFFPDYNKRTEMDSYGLPYDYDSVMHLGIEDFAIDSKVPTMTAMDDDVDLTRLGQRDGLSVLDARKLRVAYGCEVRPA